MLDQIINLVKENAGDIINNNPAIPVDKKQETAEIAGQSIVDGLKSSLASGNIKDVFKLFSGSEQVDSNPVTQNVADNFTNDLNNKLGLSGAQAGGIASTLIPSILGKLVNRTNDPNDKGFNLQDIIGQLSGGKTAGLDINAMFNKFRSGLDKDGDGDVDLSDLKSLFAGGGSGGFLDGLKGFMK